MSEPHGRGERVMWWVRERRRHCQTEGMETRRWLNQSQPQTLVIATLLLYLDAAFGVLAVLTGAGGLLLLAVIGGSIAAGYGIANERKWGYYLGIAIAAFYLLPFVLFLVQNGRLSNNLIGLAFAVAKFALLVHPQSRDYQRIWFK